MDNNGDHEDSSYLGNAYLMEDNDDGGHSMSEDGKGDGDSAGREPGASSYFVDRFLPIANVARIMKKAIPSSGKIAKDAKECCQECVSEFISFITSEASERCAQEKRKTINGEDILFAMSSLGFDNYVEPLKVFLQKYRESTKNEKGVGSSDHSLDYQNTTFDSAVNAGILAVTQDGNQQQASVLYTSSYPGTAMYMTGSTAGNGGLDAD